jgi:CRP/FNR family transcriptional regulator, anaerobic regulatory protein
MENTNFFAQFESIELNLKLQIVSLFKPIVFEKHEYLLRKGDVSQKIFFIESGVVAEIKYADGNADIDEDIEAERMIVNWMAGENEWIYQVKSFHNNEPSECAIKALEKVKAFYVFKEDFLDARQNSLEISDFVFKLYDLYLVKLEKRNSFLRLRSASQRLEYFEKDLRQLCNSLPQKYIASYLNISPSELSRIRKRRSRQHKP